MRQGEHSIPQRMYGNLQCKTISSRPINVELSLYHRGHVTNTRSSEPQSRQTSPGKKEKNLTKTFPSKLVTVSTFPFFFFFPCLQSSSVAVLTSPPQRGWWEKPINPARARAGHSPAKSAEPFAENDIKNPCQNLIFWESSCREFIKSASGNDFDFCRGEDKFS